MAPKVPAQHVHVIIDAHLFLDFAKIRPHFYTLDFNSDENAEYILSLIRSGPVSGKWPFLLKNRDSVMAVEDSKGSIIEKSLFTVLAEEMDVIINSKKNFCNTHVRGLMEELQKDVIEVFPNKVSVSFLIRKSMSMNKEFLTKFLTLLRRSSPVKEYSLIFGCTYEDLRFTDDFTMPILINREVDFLNDNWKIPRRRVIRITDHTSISALNHSGTAGAAEVWGNPTERSRTYLQTILKYVQERSQ